MRLAGVDLTNDLVAELVSLLRHEVYVSPADKLDAALAAHEPEVGLSVNERNAILDVLDDPHGGLVELREVLLLSTRLSPTEISRYPLLRCRTN